MEEDGKHVVRKSWQHTRLGNNCWEQTHYKFMNCNKELLRWSAQKKRFFQIELTNKLAKLKAQQHQEILTLQPLKFWTI